MNAFGFILMRWMKLEPIIQSEVSQDKYKYCILHVNADIWTLERW